MVYSSQKVREKKTSAGTYGYQKCLKVRLESVEFGQSLACRAISASTELLVYIPLVNVRHNCGMIQRLANTRSPEAPAAADIHLHVSPRPASASVCTPGTMGPPAYTCPSRCSAMNARPSPAAQAASFVPNMAMTFVANTFSVYDLLSFITRYRYRYLLTFLRLKSRIS